MNTVRKQIPPNYSLHMLRVGEAVVCYTSGGKSEYLGSDKLWHRRPEHCEPFLESDAVAEIAKLEAM